MNSGRTTPWQQLQSFKIEFLTCWPGSGRRNKGHTMMQENDTSHSKPTAGLGQLARRSFDRRVELLKEVTLWLLNQLELLSNSNPRDNSESFSSLSEEVRRYEVELITSALFRTHGNQKKAAKLLGVNNTTLNSKMKRYRISTNFTGLPISSLPEMGASRPATINGKC